MNIYHEDDIPEHLKRYFQLVPQLGLEKTPEEYVDNLVKIFREFKRILHPSGTFWLNLGDSYVAGGNGGGGKQDTNRGSLAMKGKSKKAPLGLKPKDLVMIPWRVALALQADGWYVRSIMPWIKRNSMPESVTDRPSSAVEYMFLLTKSDKYFYDAQAVREPNANLSRTNYKPGKRAYAEGNTEQCNTDRTRRNAGLEKYAKGEVCAGRNRRNSDWFFESWQGLYEEDIPLAFVVNPQGLKDAHFAIFPKKLVEPCIKAGTSLKGCCPDCGEPWVRVLGDPVKFQDGGYGSKTADHVGLSPTSGIRNKTWTEYKTLGWKPQCECCGVEIITEQPIKPSKKKIKDELIDDLEQEITRDETEAEYLIRLKEYEKDLRVWHKKWSKLNPIYEGLKTKRCVVFDPFMGSGTTASMAQDAGQDYIGCDLNPKYIKDICERRLSQQRIF